MDASGSRGQHQHNHLSSRRYSTKDRSSYPLRPAWQKAGSGSRPGPAPAGRKPPPVTVVQCTCSVCVSISVWRGPSGGGVGRAHTPFTPALIWGKSLRRVRAYLRKSAPCACLRAMYENARRAARGGPRRRGTRSRTGETHPGCTPAAARSHPPLLALRTACKRRSRAYAGEPRPARRRRARPAGRRSPTRGRARFPGGERCRRAASERTPAASPPPRPPCGVAWRADEIR